MSFFGEFVKNPRSIGAIAPSGVSLAEKMVQPIDFETAELIVEYGPGTGVFTKELISRRRPETVVVLIEFNKKFCRNLKKIFRFQPNMHIVNGSAENVVRILKKLGLGTPDYIISGLPFTSLPEDLSHNILTATSEVIGDKGQFITFQYSMVKKKMFLKYLKLVSVIRVMKNLPPAYVLTMKNDTLGIEAETTEEITEENLAEE